MFRFTIRELVLMTLVVALGIGWWIDHARLAPLAAESERNAHLAHLAAIGNRHAIAVLDRIMPDWQKRYPIGSLSQPPLPDEN